MSVISDPAGPGVEGSGFSAGGCISAPGGRAVGRIQRAAFGRSPWAALLFFTLAAAVFTWPLVTQMADTLPDLGDPADSAWRLGSIAQQLATDPFHLYHTAAFYPLDNGLAWDELLTGQGLLAAPIIWLTDNPPLAFNVLTFASYALSGFAAWLLVRYLTKSSAAGLLSGLVFAFSPWHNEQYPFLGLAAQQWMVFALFFLIRFTDASSRSRFMLNRRNLANLGLFTFFFVLQAIVAGYYAYQEAILVALYAGYHILFGSGLAAGTWTSLRHRLFAATERNGTISEERRALAGSGPGTSRRRRLVRLGLQLTLIAVAGALAFSALMPFILPFMHVRDEYKFHRSLGEATFWSDELVDLTTTSPGSWLQVPISRLYPNRESSVTLVLYPGVSVVLFASIGLFMRRGRRGNNRSTNDIAESDVAPARECAMLEPSRLPGPVFFAVVSLVGLVLSLGPVLKMHGQSTGITLPYAWLYEHVPGFDAMRVPHRFGLLFMFGLAVCAGYGLERLLQYVQTRNNERRPGEDQLGKMGMLARRASPGRSFALTITSLALVTSDYIAPGLGAVETGTGARTPSLYRWLAGPEAARIIARDDLMLELPIGKSNDRLPINTNPTYLMYGLSHGRPMLNGSANIIPAGYERLFFEMRRFPSSSTMDIIDALGVKFVVVHTSGLMSDAKRAQLEREAAPGGRLEQIISFPDYGGDPRFTDGVYRIVPHPERFSKLSAAIPPGSSVLLVDSPNTGRRLYTQILPRLIGANRRYFSTYKTIYDPLVGDIQDAEGRTTYDFVILYKFVNPASFGYSARDIVDTGQNDMVWVYHKH
jgi:hypothetical protein